MSTAPDSAALRRWLEKLLPQALEWLERMVAVNSFTANPGGVNRLGDLTAQCFATLGFDPEFFSSLHPVHGRHLVLRRHGAPRPPIVLVTHLDTVFPEEEERRNCFEWRVSPGENRIYGPGTVDIKGGTVLQWMILQGMREFFPDLWEANAWTVAANASEEAIGDEFGVLLKRLHPEGARAVLVFEGGPRALGKYQLVTSRKGRAEYRIRARGVAAHAGSAHAEGINAIGGLCRAIGAAEQLTDYARGLTVNVGAIRGGTVVNRVPHMAEADLEIRAFEPETLANACSAIESLAAPLEGAHRKACIEVECLGKSPAWPTQAATERLFAVWDQVGASLGLRVERTARGGLSDANYLWSLGPTLDGLGPSGGNAHCSECSADGSRVPEYVEMDSFVPKALWNLLSLRALLEDSGT